MTFTLAFCNLVYAGNVSKMNKSQTFVYGEMMKSQKSSGVCKDFTYADLVEIMMPAVVNLSITGSKEVMLSPFGRIFGPGILEQFGITEENPLGGTVKRKVSSVGSGFIISGDGFVVTNYHLIEDSEKIIITTSDDREFIAKVIGFDKKTDIAVLQIDSSQIFPFVDLGNSSQVRIGDRVIAIGNPFGFGGTVTSGIVSAKSRHIEKIPYEDFIQTDADINLGNSGGPMFDMYGNVIGITTAIISKSGGSMGLNFAIPADVAKPIVEKLMKKEKITRAWLGVVYNHMNEKIAEAVGLKDVSGAFVQKVHENSPASKGGIKVGDIILSLNNVVITKNTYIPSLVFNAPVGTKIEAVVWRNNKKQVLNLVLEEQKEDIAIIDKNENVKKDNSDIANVVTIDASVTSKMQLPSGLEGVIVKDVSDKFLRSNGEIKKGDIILRVGGNIVKNQKDFDKSFKNAKNSNRRYIIVEFYRRGQSVLEAVQVKD